MGERQGHRRQPLGGRVHNDHRVPLPGLARQLVPNSAPQIDDFLAAIVGAAGAAQFAAPDEVFLERVTHGFEAATDVSLDNV